LLTVAAAAALGVGAFALPAAAQTPVPSSVFVEDYSPIAIGDEPELFGMRIEFDDGLGAGEHAVTATVAIDAPDNTFEIGLEDGSATDCPFNDAATVVSCEWEWEASDVAAFWEFRYRPLDDAEPGVYDYTVEFAVDGAVVDTVEDSIEVTAGEDDGGDDEDYPYLHSDVEYTDVKPGDGVAFAADFQQAAPLTADAAAVVVTALAPEYLPAGLARPTAGYDNCVESDAGVSCVVTEFANSPGTVFGFADPITYEVSGTAPGPIDVCNCTYSVRTVNADRLEEEFGGVFWDEDSDNLFGLRVVTEPESEFEDPYSGNLEILTSANPFDLSVSDVNAKGAKGTEATLSTTVKNLGPADAVSVFDGPGSYGIIGSLPKGLELVDADLADDDSVNCFEPDDPHVKHSFPDVDLSKADFVCVFPSLGADDSFTFEFKVTITDANANGKGTLEVAAMDNDGYPGIADGDTKNNLADITVNGSGSGQLPKTGVSLSMILGAAALVLVVGVVLLVVTSRRRRAAAEE
jgi:LPXTG-motif cell wall-anchored protein